MLAAMLLFITPVVLFVIAFLYETYISFRRIMRQDKGRAGYLSATWEVTHTLLVFAVVMLVMLFSSSIEGISSAIFVSTFLAAGALTLRAVAYLYIFYVRSGKQQGAIDWIFALSHLVAALALVTTVLKALWYIYKHDPAINSQFLPLYLPGLVLVLLICAVPMIGLYKTKD